MPKQILLRDVPEDIHAWIANSSYEYRISRRKFALMKL